MSNELDPRRRLDEVRKILDTPAPDDATNSLPRLSVVDPTLDESDLPGPTGWLPIPLTGEWEPSIPTMLRTRQGGALLYPGKTHLFLGETESGKSLVALIAAREVLQDGGRVLWIDYEDTPASFQERCTALGIPEAHYKDRVDYLNPSSKLREGKLRDAWTRGALDLQGLLAAHSYDLAVIDGVSMAMGIEGLDMNSATDVGAFFHSLPSQIARTGAAVLMLTHVKKNAEGGDRFGLGSQAWLGLITGAAYKLAITRPFGKTSSPDPGEGQIRVTISKDRAAGVRGSHSYSDAFVLITARCYPDETLDLLVDRARDTVALPPMRTITALLDYVRKFPGSAKSTVVKAVEGNDKELYSTITHLVGKGCFVVERVGRSHLLTVNEAAVRAADY